MASRGSNNRLQTARETATAERRSGTCEVDPGVTPALQLFLIGYGIHDPSYRQARRISGSEIYMD